MVSAVADFLTSVDVPEVSSIASISAVAAVPYYNCVFNVSGISVVDGVPARVPSAVGVADVANGPGVVPAVASVPAVAGECDPSCRPCSCCNTIELTIIGLRNLTFGLRIFGDRKNNCRCPAHFPKFLFNYMIWRKK